jgi:ligand-binding sensor domain-containing protein/signal transduction histidine kinase
MQQAHSHGISTENAHRIHVFRRASRSAATWMSFAVALTALLNAVARAQTYQSSRASGVPEVSVSPHTIRLPLIDGDDIRFTRLSTSAGLSQTRVSQIVQDDQGFMWFGTQYGLNRFDGYKFRVFTPDPASANSISGAYIYSLLKDRTGILWVGCDQFLDRFDPITETFTHYRLISDDSNPVPVTVVQVSQDSAGMLWLATGSGLYEFDPATRQVIHHYIHDPLRSSSLSSNDVRSAGEDRGGTFWVGDANNLEQFDRKTGKVTLRVSLAESVRDFSFYEDRFGVFWIFNSGRGGLALLDRNAKKLTHYSFYDSKSGQTVTVGVYAILEDKNGTLWFGTMGQGLLKFDRELKRAIRYRNHPDQVESLAEDRVITLAEDREGNIWVGLHASEPNFFSARSTSFHPLLRNGLNPNSLGESFVNAIYEDRQGVLWVGATGSLIRLDRNRGKYSFYRPGSESDIVAITEDRSGAMWVGTIGRGLNRFDRETGQFKTYLHDPADPSSLSNDAVDQLFVDERGRMWATTWDGLNRFEPATGRFLVYKRDVQNRTESYYDIAEDQDGELWLGGTSGLQRFDPTKGKFTGGYEHKLDDPSSLSDNRVTSIYIDRLGALWAATENGLDKLDLKTGTFTRYYVRDGLPSNRVHCILGDQHGELWMSTNRGLSRFDPLGKTFKNYSVADGLPGMDLTGWHGCFKASTGEMFFGGFSGAVAFYPDKIVDNSYSPPIVFTDFRLSGHSVEVGGRSPLRASIGYTDSLALSNEQNNFSLEFAALDYSNWSMNRYRYKLDGSDAGWNEVGSDQRVVNYNVLPAGNYTFRVQVETGHSGWSVPGAALRIEILPPWWRTWWFRITCAVFVVLMALAAYSYRMQQTAAQFELRLEERVNERTRIARELHDTLLQSFNGLLMRFQAVSNELDEGEPKQELDDAINRAARAITEGRDAVQGLRSSAVESNDLAAALGTLGKELAAADSRPPEFTMQVEGAQRDLHPILRDEVYRVAGEALRNAFRHANAQRIEVEIRYDERQLRLRVRDDGEGIDPNLLVDSGRAGHFGLRGMRERAKRVGGELTVWSSDPRSDRELESGTEVELSIPAARAYARFRAPLRSWLAKKFAGKDYELKS